MLVTNYRPTNRDLDPSALLENGRVSGQAKLTIMRPNLDRYHHTPLSHDQPFSNSSSRYSIPGSVKPYLLMPNRRKSPILDYPMHHVRSGGPKVYHRQSRMPNDHRNSHQKFFSHKISSHSFSHSNSLVPTIEDSQFLKRMIPSRPPQSYIFNGNKRQEIFCSRTILPRRQHLHHHISLKMKFPSWC